METKEELHGIFLERLSGIGRKKFGFGPEKIHGLIRRIAEEIEVDEGTVRKWFDEDEKAMPRLEQFIKICKRLHVTADYLLGIEDEPKPKEFIACIEITDQDKQMIEQTGGMQKFIEMFVPIPVAKGEMSGGPPHAVREDPDEITIVYHDWAQQKKKLENQMDGVGKMLQGHMGLSTIDLMPDRKPKNL